MSSHDEYAALLDAFLDGELSEAEAEGVRVHLSECADCQAYVADALAIRDAFPDIEETVVPDGFAESVLAALPPRRVSWRAQWAKIVLPLAACAALVILVHGIAERRAADTVTMSADTEEAFMTGMDAGGGSPVPGSTAVADDADTVPPQAPELYDAAEAQSTQNAATEETIPFTMRSSETEAPGEGGTESVSNRSAAPAAAKEVPGEYAATETFPEKDIKTEEFPDENPATKTVPYEETGADEDPATKTLPYGETGADEDPATKTVPYEETRAEEFPDEDPATKIIPYGETKADEFPDGETKTESVDGKEPLPDEFPPKPEPGVNEVTLLGESGEKEETEFPEKYETADSLSLWTLPPEALDLFDDYAPAEKTESGIWYALTPEEFDALSQKFAKMGMEIVSGADALPSMARPGMEYVFVPL